MQCECYASPHSLESAALPGQRVPTKAREHDAGGLLAFVMHRPRVADAFLGFVELTARSRTIIVAFRGIGGRIQRAVCCVMLCVCLHMFMVYVCRCVCVCVGILPQLVTSRT